MTGPSPLSADTAPQHGPRPLPLFLDLLRRETAASPGRRAAALAGVRAYQDAPRAAPPPPPRTVARAGRARLLGYGDTGRPVVFVPSLINAPIVLDLDADTSLLRWLAGQGVMPLLVDWGTPGPGDRAADLDVHVADLLLPLLRSIAAPPVLVGYCLGGTLAVAAAALMPVAGLALIAAPWRFSGFGEAARARIADLWTAAQPACDRLDLVPMEVLQAGFWRLDPAAMVRKFERFPTLAPDAARRFVAIEDWANGGAPIPYAAARQLFDDLFDADMPGTGRWTIDGTAIDPLALACPMVEFVAANDRIVPAASAIGLADARMLDAGHVGMVVGSRAREQLWRPLSDWITALPPAR